MTRDIQLVAIDLDGTLLRDDKSLSQENVDAIKDAIEQGVQVVICTGRTLPSIQYLSKQLPQGHGDEYLILQNGAVIHQLPDLNIVHETILTESDRQAIYDVFKEYRSEEVQMVAFDPDKLYLVDDETANPTVVQDAKTLSTDITLAKFEEVLNLETLYKIVVFGGVEFIDDYLEKIPNDLYEQVHIVRSLPVAIEFIPKLANKANGLNALIQLLDIKAENIMTIGDELNDYEMVKMAGLGVAMENGHPEVKRVADELTLTNNENGVAHAIRKFVTQPPHNS
ncbi:Cof-type HAD-IIB family hydrolase [Ruoffia tabacinasalis]|uniref:HAD family phosphatase n=1 Tax=Ruoffia tabacinasalis TaxID=87458 RepID=A0ABS0LN12_9LACT|nr:Cof-type HAD-IIB family hydrolase [Ruoffia tabacinasalis]MBG9979000.1 HAD family phosphatase [Ruoffia tabacinasalis]